MKRLIYVFCLMSLAQCLTAGNMPPRRLFDAEKREGDTRPKPDLAPTSPSIPLRSGEGRVRSKSPGWQPNGIAVCDTANCFLPKIVTDGNSGAIICWTETYRGADSVNNYTDDIYAQRVDSGGNIVWESQGVPVCSLGNSWSSYPAMIADGKGGAIIAWEDSRGGLGYTRVFAQRIDSLGNRLWTENGVLVCNQMSGYVNLCTDGHGGAIIAYVDGRDQAATSDNIYAQRIDSAGNPVWAIDGVPVCTADSIQFWPFILSNITGGAIITWGSDIRNGNGDIYAQKVDSNGSNNWLINGAAICTKPGFQNGGYSTYNNYGGAVIEWIESNDSYKTYLQSIDSIGIIKWDSNGISAGRRYSGKLCSDNRGGGILTGPFAVQRVDTLGNICWNPSGVLLHSDTTGGNKDAVSDENGGVIVIWDELRVNPFYSNQYTQKIDSSGNALWGANGVPVCTLQMRYESYPQVTYDGLGGALFTWFGSPWHTSPYNGVYVQRIYPDGTPGGVAGEPVLSVNPSIKYIKTYPNPFSTTVKIQFQISKKQHVALNIYNIAGQLVREIFSGIKTPGRYSVAWDGRDKSGCKATSGIYLITIGHGSFSKTQKMIKLK